MSRFPSVGGEPAERRETRMARRKPTYEELEARVAELERQGDRTDPAGKQAGEASPAPDATYRSIFNAANDAIFVHHMETGVLLDVNRKMCEMYGYTVEEARQLDVEALSAGVPPYTQKEALRWIRKAVEGEPQLFEWRARDKQGNLFWVEVNLKRVWIEDRERLLAVVRDITERKRMEEMHRKLETKIQQTQRLESLGILAGGIAHDFNNLLVAILGYTDLVLADLSPESPVRTDIERIRKASLRAAELTNQMLAYSGKGRFVIRSVQLNELVNEMSHLLKRSISKKASLRFDLAPDLPAIAADPAQLTQVVMNLLTNASEAIGDENGVITVSTGSLTADAAYLAETFLKTPLREGPYVYLEVSDTGCGLDEATREKIFDPFFSTKFTGRGLGLAAVLGIVRGHNGAIQVYSEKGTGTTFKVLFPVSPGTRTETAPEPVPPGKTLEPRFEAGTVLVIDDELSVRETARAMLERNGFSVRTAGDGREGVEIFREHADEIRVVLLDMTMPYMNGEEVFRELRRIRPRARVILSSGYNEQDATNRFAGKGLAGFIRKPYGLSDLISAVRRVLDPGEEPG
jgi:two-component system, cell cycle sensor histidine kinase and response regulator CckA